MQNKPTKSHDRGIERSYILVAALVILGIVHISAGAWLALLGGTLYYVVAGLVLTACAYFIARNDRKGEWLYAIFLGLTLSWALWEESSLWGWQSRLTLPLLMGLWVYWPSVWNHKFASGLALLVAVIAGSGYLALANRVETVGDNLSGWESVSDTSGEWIHYGNDLGGSRFSPLTQITPANVGGLEQAWVYHTGDTGGMGFQATPLMVDDFLYLCTQSNTIHALDPESGKAKWVFDPKTKTPPAAACRGVAFYQVPGSDRQSHCDRRVIFGTTDARLMAVDAYDGQLCEQFGDKGTVDLKHKMGDVIDGYYYLSSAPTIVRGNVVIGGWVLDGQYVGEPSGVIRAFDAVTGEFSWAWDMDRPDFQGLPGDGETYSRGTANSWGPMSGDEELGLVFLPTGNSTPDYWGAHRSEGSEKYSTSVVALDAETGRLRWSFQTVHHDVWDYDVSAQPTLIDLTIDGKDVPALVQATKQGQMFLLDRRNGKLLADVEERPVPQGPAEGDWLSPTQPFSVGMPAFDNTVLSERTMWGMTSIDQLWCRIKFRQARYEGPFTPPGVRPTITYPSYLGGVNWGGVSVNPDKNLMIVNWNRMANYTRLVPREEADAKGLGISKDGGIHVGQPVPQKGTPFALETFAFLSPLGVPCTEPPFGKIAVVDLDSRDIVWEKPLGTGADSGPFGIPSRIPVPIGVPNAGGSLTTRSGLTFIGATQEKAIRAYHTETGKMLWKHRLPAGGHASPMSYISKASGRQFVVISAGGSAPLHSGYADTVVAFSIHD